MWQAPKNSWKRAHSGGLINWQMEEKNSNWVSSQFSPSRNYEHMSKQTNEHKLSVTRE